MIYTFEDDDGRRYEFSMSPNDAPPIGKRVTGLFNADGELETVSLGTDSFDDYMVATDTRPHRPIRRVVSQLQVDGGRCRLKYPVVSRSLPRNMEGFRCNEVGQPIIRSPQEAREAAARANRVKE